jgi:hypothetical protein
MPTYTNSTARTVTLRGGTGLKKHKSIKKYTTGTTDFYPTTLPVGVTFVSNEPVSSPFKELANIHEFPSDPVLCMGYNSLMFHNETSDVVGFYANGDTANVLEIPVGVFMTIDADGLFGSIVFVYGGSSSKGVTLWGS